MVYNRTSQIFTMSENKEIIRVCVINNVDDGNCSTDDPICNIKVEIADEEFSEYENTGFVFIDVDENSLGRDSSKLCYLGNNTQEYEALSNVEEAAKTKVKTIYTCEVCGYSSQEKRNYMRHLKTHVTTFDLSCAICGIDTDTKGKLSLHMSTHKCPDDPKMYQCNRCSYKSNKLANLKQHMDVHYKSKAVVYECHLCNFKSKIKSNYVAHTTLHKSEKVPKCDICDLTFISRACLREHMADHKCPSDDTRYQCPKCSYSGIKLYNLKVHMFVHKSEFEIEMLPCPHCPFKAKRKTDLSQHITLKHKSKDEILLYECDHCLFQTKTRTHLILHLTNKHKDSCQENICCYCNYRTISDFLFKRHINQHEEKGLKGYCFLCSLCGKKYRRRVELNKHIACFHKSEVTASPNSIRHNTSDDEVRIEDVEMEQVCIDKSKTIKCAECNFVTDQEMMLKNHMIIVHNKSGTDNKCTECTFHTTSRHLYLDHLKVHNINVEHLKPHLCEICGSRWVRKGDLTRHMSVHWDSQENNLKEFKR